MLNVIIHTGFLLSFHKCFIVFNKLRTFELLVILPLLLWCGVIRFLKTRSFVISRTSKSSRYSDWMAKIIKLEILPLLLWWCNKIP